MGRGSWYSDDEGAIPQGMWLHNVQRTLYSDKGQAMLRRLEKALLALPQKRLIEGDIATKEGDVCALGALAAHARMLANRWSWATAIATLADEYDGCGNEETVALGEELGFTQTAAIEIAGENDNDWMGLAPERRYDHMVEWVQSYLMPISWSEARQRFPYLEAYCTAIPHNRGFFSLMVTEAVAEDVPRTVVFKDVMDRWVHLDDFLARDSIFMEKAARKVQKVKAAVEKEQGVVSAG